MQNNSAENSDEANAVDPNWGDDENYGANRPPAEQSPFTTRWNFASGLFVPGIATEKALGAAQFRLMPNKTKEWAGEETLGQTQVKPSRQSETDHPGGGGANDRTIGEQRQGIRVGRAQQKARNDGRRLGGAATEWAGRHAGSERQTLPNLLSD